MQTRIRFSWLFILILMLALPACRSAPPEDEELIPVPDAILTAAAQTAAANLTETARPLPTDTLVPTDTPTSGAATPTATATTSPGDQTPVTTPTGTGTPGDVAELLEDVTIPDGTTIAPGVAYTKTWRLKNSGTTTWTTAYSLVFIDGAQMGGPDAIPLAENVTPGSTDDISVNLIAPLEPGNYRGFWKMRNADGQFFDMAVYVEINVATGTPGPTFTPDPDSNGQVTSVTLSIDSPSADSCPHTFTFTGSITLNAAASVTYQLEAGTSTPGFVFTLPPPNTADLPAGSHPRTFFLTITDPVVAWARLRVTAPNEIVSEQVTFSLTCND